VLVARRERLFAVVRKDYSKSHTFEISVARIVLWEELEADTKTIPPGKHARLK
jgi:hypothetical protein